MTKFSHGAADPQQRPPLPPPQQRRSLTANIGIMAFIDRDIASVADANST